MKDLTRESIVRHGTWVSRGASGPNFPTLHFRKVISELFLFIVGPGKRRSMDKGLILSIKRDLNPWTLPQALRPLGHGTLPIYAYVFIFHILALSPDQQTRDRGQ